MSIANGDKDDITLNLPSEVWLLYFTLAGMLRKQSCTLWLYLTCDWHVTEIMLMKIIRTLGLGTKHGTFSWADKCLTTVSLNCRHCMAYKKYYYLWPAWIRGLVKGRYGGSWMQYRFPLARCLKHYNQRKFQFFADFSYINRNPLTLFSFHHLWSYKHFVQYLYIRTIAQGLHFPIFIPLQPSSEQINNF